MAAWLVLVPPTEQITGSRPSGATSSGSPPSFRKTRSFNWSKKTRNRKYYSNWYVPEQSNGDSGFHLNNSELAIKPLVDIDDIAYVLLHED